MADGINSRSISQQTSASGKSRPKAVLADRRLSGNRNAHATPADGKSPNMQNDNNAVTVGRGNTRDGPEND